MKRMIKLALAAIVALTGITATADVQLVEEAALVTECGPTKQLYFENRSLADVQDIAMTCKQGFGGSQNESEYRWSLPKTASGAFKGQRPLPAL